MDAEIREAVERYESKLGRLNVTTITMNFDLPDFRAEFLAKLETAIATNKPLSDADFGLDWSDPNVLA